MLIENKKKYENSVNTNNLQIVNEKERDSYTVAVETLEAKINRIAFGKVSRTSQLILNAFVENSEKSIDNVNSLLKESVNPIAAKHDFERLLQIIDSVKSKEKLSRKQQKEFIDEALWYIISTSIFLEASRRDIFSKYDYVRSAIDITLRLNNDNDWFKINWLINIFGFTNPYVTYHFDYLANSSKPLPKKIQEKVLRINDSLQDDF